METPDKNSFDAVTIRAVENGYIVTKAPSRQDPLGMVPSDLPYVFSTFSQLSQWLQGNLVVANKTPQEPAKPQAWPNQRPRVGCGYGCSICYPEVNKPQPFNKPVTAS